MFAGKVARRFGNELYKVAFPIYRPLYSVFKIYADRAERQILTQQLSAGCVAVDVGANIGIYSQFLSRCVGPAGAVHSFEPSTENFRHLSAAVAGLPNVRVNELAVSDKTGRSLLYVSDKLNVDHHTYPTREKRERPFRLNPPPWTIILRRGVAWISLRWMSKDSNYMRCVAPNACCKRTVM